MGSYVICNPKKRNGDPCGYTIKTLLVTHTILDEKLSKFDESLNDCEHYL